MSFAVSARLVGSAAVFYLAMGRTPQVLSCNPQRGQRLALGLLLVVTQAEARPILNWVEGPVACRAGTSGPQPFGQLDGTILNKALVVPAAIPVTLVRVATIFDGTDTIAHSGHLSLGDR